MKHINRFLLFFALLALCQTAQAQELKIISFNIRYNSWNNIDGENGWPNRKAAVVKMINEEKPAAIGLQEALIDQLQYLDSCLPQYRRIGVGRDDGKLDGEFMAIYYDTARLELVNYRTRWLSETPEEPSPGWDAACRRTVTIARFSDRLSDKEFDYFNTHLDHVGKTARAEGAQLIAETAGGYETSDVPAIIGGDMNSTIDDNIFQAFYNTGFKVARDLPSVTSRVDTYTGFGKDKPSLIDHFFVRNVEVELFRTLNGDYGVPYISDHYPIEMVIRL